MSAIELREEIIKYLEEVKDEHFLKVVYSMLDTYLKEPGLKGDLIVGYEVDGTPVTSSAFVNQAQAAVDAAKQGNYITPEELEKRSKEWLERTK